MVNGLFSLIHRTGEALEQRLENSCFFLIVVVVNETTNVIKITKFKSEGVADAVGFVTPLC